MSIGRNAPCPCGSGHKYKHCCGDKERTFLTAPGLLLVLIVGGVAVAAMIGALKSEPSAGQVWSPEHRHYHNVGQGSPANPTGSPIPKPLGPAPPGKVWSPQHGHWHNVSQGSLANPTGSLIPQPLGPAPPGKVWSPEHGHWHDAR